MPAEWVSKLDFFALGRLTLRPVSPWRQLGAFRDDVIGAVATAATNEKLSSVSWTTSHFQKTRAVSSALAALPRAQAV